MGCAGQTLTGRHWEGGQLQNTDSRTGDPHLVSPIQVSESLRSIIPD